MVWALSGGGGAGEGDSVGSVKCVNITFFSSHHSRYRFRARTALPSLRTSVYTATALRLLYIDYSINPNATFILGGEQRCVRNRYGKSATDC